MPPTIDDATDHQWCDWLSTVSKFASSPKINKIYISTISAKLQANQFTTV